MSKKSELPNDKIAAQRYVEWLSSNSRIHKIYIGGSRSPKSKKPPRKESDWDFIATTIDDTKVLIMSPRQLNQIHGDLIVIPEDSVKHQTKAVEIWPTDKHNIIS